MANITIIGVAKLASGSAWANARVEIRLDGESASEQPVSAVAGADGSFSVDVWTNATVAAVGRCKLPDGSVFTFNLDPDEASLDIGILQTDGGDGSVQLEDSGVGGSSPAYLPAAGSVAGDDVVAVYDASTGTMVGATVEQLASVSRDYALEFDGTAQHVNHGSFYQENVAYFRLFADFLIKPTGPGYVLSAGYGGSHDLLFGVTGSAGGPYTITGNVYNSDTATATSFSTYDHLRHNEWAYVAIAYNETNICLFINGVPSAQVPLITQRKTSATTDGVLFIGGSDHLNFAGRIAGVRIFEIGTGGTLPFTYFNVARRPPVKNFAMVSVKNGSNIVEASFLADYREGSLADISKGLSGLHNGYLAEATQSITAVQGESADPNLYNRTPSLRPKWVVDPFTFPTSSAASKTPIVGARIYDDFARPDQHYGVTTTLNLGATTVGIKTWTTPGNHYGILDGNVFIDNTNVTNAIISDTQTDGTIVWKRPVGANITGVGAVYQFIFRYVDDLNYEQLYVDEYNQCLVREIVAGSPTNLGDVGGGGTWTEIKVVLLGTSVTVYKNGTSLGSKTMSQNLTGTGKGFALNHPLLRCSEFGVI